MYEVLIGECTYSISVTHFSGGCDAYVSGLPENCYPAEAPELEWKAATGDDDMDYLINNLGEKELTSIEEQLVAQIIEEADSYDGPDSDEM